MDLAVLGLGDTTVDSSIAAVRVLMADNGAPSMLQNQRSSLLSSSSSSSSSSSNYHQS